MKVTTTIQQRLDNKPKNPKLAITAIIAETAINTMLPFALGFYFAKTENPLIVFGFVILLFVHVRITHTKNKLKLKIIRGL